jgi:hypothetical protein
MNELLKALAEADREREAPPAVEARLRSAFRKKYQRRAWPYFALAAAAAIALYIKVPAKRPLDPQVKEIAVVTPPAPIVAPIEKATPRKVIHRKPAPREEVVTEFYPLMEDPMPFERGELLRVNLPAAAMRTVGVPVSEDRLGEIVQADVLVGQEGLARAIRFVNTSVNRP